MSTDRILSVVVPTLDAAAVLPAVLAALDGSRLAREVVVSDGGSGDDTVALARSAGARVVSGAVGRGAQLARGARVAAGDWLLFLHSDTILDPGWEGAVAAHLDRPDARDRAGYFRFALDDPAPAARRLERVVATRARLLGLPYGDQGLLVSRALYDAVGGFRPLALMEDVDLVRRIGRHRLAALDCRAVTSAARYRRAGYLARSCRNLLCLSLYFLGLPPRTIAKIYG